MADGGVEGLAVPSFLIEEYDSLPTIITKGSDLEDAKYIKGLQVVIKDLADRDNVVIVGRGSSIILRDEPGVLRVGLFANWWDCVSRIQEREHLSQAEAEKPLSNGTELGLSTSNAFSASMLPTIRSSTIW